MPDPFHTAAVEAGYASLPKYVDDHIAEFRDQCGDKMDSENGGTVSALDLDALESAAKAATPDRLYELNVCRWHGRITCVYLNDYRVAGGKPWGGGETAARWDISLNDLSEAVPAIAALNPATALALISALRASQAETKAALKECGDWAAQAGLAKGKLEASELAGVVEGWQHRATTAEAEVERLKAEISAFGDLQNECANMDVEMRGKAETIEKLVRALTMARDRMKMLLPATLDGSDHPGATQYVITYAEAALSRTRPSGGGE